jgi:hypothetical protein
VTVPSSVTVPGGTASVSFPISVSANQAKTTATITATRGSSVVTATFNIAPAAIVGLVVSPSSFVGGSLADLYPQIKFNGPAPGGAVEVKLTSSNPAVISVPKSITLTPTATSLTFSFPLTHFKVNANTTVKITATGLNGKVTTSCTVQPFQVITMSAVPSSVAGGLTSQGTAFLNANPNSKTGALKVLLSKTGSTALTVPASVSVPVGQFTGSFTMTTKAVKADAHATVVGKLGASSAKVAMTVLLTSLNSLVVAPSTFVGGSNTSVTGTVTIGTPAPAGGLVVHLMSYDTSGQLTVPATVTIPAGKTTATFTVTHHTVPIMEIVQISATVDGQTLTASVTVNP